MTKLKRLTDKELIAHFEKRPAKEESVGDYDICVWERPQTGVFCGSVTNRKTLAIVAILYLPTEDICMKVLYSLVKELEGK